MLAGLAPVCENVVCVYACMRAYVHVDRHLWSLDEGTGTQGQCVICVCPPQDAELRGQRSICACNETDPFLFVCLYVNLHPCICCVQCVRLTSCPSSSQLDKMWRSIEDRATGCSHLVTDPPEPPSASNPTLSPC